MRTRASVWLGGIAVLVVVALGCSGRDRREHNGGGKSTSSVGLATPTVSVAPISSAPVAISGHPNILFILSDDQRADSLSCMPRLKKLVMDQGVTFANYYATTPLCCPGRSTILTGKYAHNHGVLSNGDSEEGDEVKVPGAIDFKRNGNEEIVIARYLRDAGYRTGFVGKYLNGYEKMTTKKTVHVPPYWDDWFTFNHAEYYDFELIERPRGAKPEIVCYDSSLTGSKKKHCKDADRTVSDGKENYSTDVLKDKAVGFIKAAAAEKKPFFLYFAPKAPHAPYDSPSRYQTAIGRDDFTAEAKKRLGECPLYDWKDRPASVLEDDVSDKPPWIQEAKGTITADKVDKVRHKQLMSVLAIEDALEEILATLDSVGQRNNTIIVYNGDNGYAWGEHWWIGKNCTYETCAHVPLVIYDPRTPTGGKTEASFALNIDLFPTLAELAGVPIPAEVKRDGKSLVSTMKGGGAARERFLLECWGLATKAHPDVHSAVRTKRWKYVEHYEDDKRTKVRQRKGGGAEIELYDLEKDPGELDNLAVFSEPERKKKGYSAGEVDKVIAELTVSLKQLEKE